MNQELLIILLEMSETRLRCPGHEHNEFECENVSCENCPYNYVGQFDYSHVIVEITHEPRIDINTKTDSQ